VILINANRTTSHEKAISQFLLASFAWQPQSRQDSSHSSIERLPRVDSFGFTIVPEVSGNRAIEERDFLGERSANETLSG